MEVGNRLTLAEPIDATAALGFRSGQFSHKTRAGSVPGPRWFQRLEGYDVGVPAAGVAASCSSNSKSAVFCQSSASLPSSMRKMSIPV
jgi:hypothetical protein